MSPATLPALLHNARVYLRMTRDDIPTPRAIRKRAATYEAVSEHRAAATCQRRPELDPLQQAPPPPLRP